MSLFLKKSKSGCEKSKNLTANKEKSRDLHVKKVQAFIYAMPSMQAKATTGAR